ncbi:MAG: 4Fe-4S binding protein [Pelatocladus maniniholoensis HA4357-MV3]|uniref:4Fe-4S binding protein n=1 Tax=Pelatocladus maniniholoensis HA4357-MV3 TaxID=1117104 RepID=A0A9E3LTB6_9NOST|nr:4Fe-4S binding protein [Pelatocladus maniniholoensis HA4357-MV3]BAZ66829.1 4Fe-4S ferredoxin, iron-sulfur binding protein [Fischerella sp. NIES-4106]
MTDHLNPLQSLKEGHWFKLICGASFQHLPAVRSLTLAYTLAGADCIDVAADPAVITAVREALQIAVEFAEDAQARGFANKGKSPFLMVSLNDGEDPHFRKAKFDSTACPANCNRPCERICPAQAIEFSNTPEHFSGVISNKCYGCGRCIPICPYGIINTSSYVIKPEAIAPLILSSGVDAIEIHTQVGRLTEFQRLWQTIAPWVEQLKLVAISCPDGEGMIDYLHALYDAIAIHNYALIWQTDGRPMSGDIGDGTTTAAVKLGQKVLAAKLPGYVQLAGGTNSYTVAKLRAMGLLRKGGQGRISPISPPSSLSALSHISGIAYGSYARVLLSPILEQLEAKEVNDTSVKTTVRLENEPELLWQAVGLAHSLVSQLKSQQ